jgi:hypothetical protein
MPDITDQLDFIQSPDLVPGAEAPSAKLTDDEDLKDKLLTIFRHIETQELPTRELLLRQWKFNLLLWQGIQSIYWSSVANEWEPLSGETLLPQDITIDPSVYNKVANILRPYGESIAGALATGLPTVRYFPYNAEDPADLSTAKTYSKIEKLINTHNTAELLLLQAIMYFYKFGYVAAYNFPHQSDKYGTIEKDETVDQQYNTTESFCPECGEMLGSEKEECPKDFTEDVEATIPELLPEDIEDVKEGPEKTCPECGYAGPTQVTETQSTEPKDIKVEYNKFRQLIQLFGPLQVKIPVRAQSLDQVIWLIYEDEFHIAQLKCLYPEFADKITSSSSPTNAYERYIRSNWEEYYENLNDYATCDRVWLRDDSYYILPKDQAEELKSRFPNGIMFTVINNDIVEIKEEMLDDHWTMTFSPGDNRVYADPGCKSTVPMQLLTNEILQLQVECFKYALPTAFADPEYLDFTEYSKSQKQPGLIYPMKRPPNGEPMANNVTSLTTAVYPKESAELDAKVEKLAQFTSGALPNIWGGPTSGSKTLGEYEQQRNQALQRVGITWKIIVQWWAKLMAKTIKGYIENMQGDEHFVQEHGDSFINVWIRKSELLGKVGDITPEISEQFPSSWAQTSAKVMELIGMQNEMINSILSHPSNAELIAKTIGVPDLYIPGEDQRNKELLMIATVLKAPSDIDPMTGQPTPIMAPPVDPLTDDLNSQPIVLKSFLASEAGVDLQSSNPAAYQALLQRLMQFQQIVLQQQMAAAATAPQVEEPPPTE